MSINKNNRTTFAMKNLVSSFILQIVTVILNMITLRLFIEAYGSSTNGLIASITQILSYVMLVEAGLGVASIQALYKPIAENNKKEINSILSATKSFYIKAGIYFLFILGVIAIVYPKFIHSEISYYKISLIILVMSIPTIIDYFFQGKLRVLITADQKAYVINIIQIISILLSSIIRVILITKGYDVIFVQIVYGFISLIKVILLYVFFIRKYKWVSFNEIPNNEALKKRWAALVHQIAGLVVNGSAILIIGMFCGLEEASVYSLYNLIFTTVTNFMWIFANSVTPGFGQLITTEKIDIVKNAYSRFESIFYMFMFIIYTTVYLMVTPFISLYTNNISDIQYSNEILPILFTITNILNCLRIPANNMINASGEFSNTKRQAILEAIINIVVSLLCVKFIGIYGVLIGSIVSFLYRTTDIILYTNRIILPKTIRATIKRIVTNLITSICSIICLRDIVRNYSTSWILLLINSIIVVVSIGVIFIVFNYILDKQNVKSNILRIRTVFFNKNRKSEYGI